MTSPENSKCEQLKANELDSGFVCQTLGDQPPIASPHDSQMLMFSSLDDEAAERTPPPPVQGATVLDATPQPQVNLVGIKHTKSGRWEAKITLKKNFFYLGTFDTAEEALRARRRKRLEFDFSDFSEENRKKQKTEKSQVILEEDYVSAHRSVRYVLGPNMRLQKVSSSDSLENEASKGKFTSEKCFTRDVVYCPRDLPPGIRKSFSGRRWEAYTYDPIRKAKLYLGSYPTAEEASAAYDRKKAEFGSKGLQQGKKKKKKNQYKHKSLLINSKFGSPLVKEHSRALENDLHLASLRGENIASGQEPKRYFVAPTSTNCTKVMIDQMIDDSGPELLFNQKSDQPELDFKEDNARQPVRYVLKPDPRFAASLSSFIQKDEAVKDDTTSSLKHVAGQAVTSGAVNCEIKLPPGLRLRRTKAGNRWEAYIHNPIKKAKFYVGSYATVEQAVEARHRKRLEFQLICLQRNKSEGSNASIKQEKSGLTTEVDSLTGKGRTLLTTHDSTDTDKDAYIRKRREFESMVHLNESRSSELKGHSEFDQWGLGCVHQASDIQNGTSMFVLPQVLEGQQHVMESDTDLGHMKIPFHPFTDGGEFDDSDIANTDGQFVDEYCWLDDELWICRSRGEDDDE